jgi:hypothetical protein
MSGRYRNDDATDGCVKALFSIILIGGYFVIDFLINFFRTPLYEKLRRLNQIAYWNTVIEATVCPNCTASNELAYVNCWSCNQLLTRSPQAKHLSKGTTNTIAVEAPPTVFANKDETENLPETEQRSEATAVSEIEKDTISASVDEEVESPPPITIPQEIGRATATVRFLMTVVALIIALAVMYFFFSLAGYGY